MNATRLVAILSTTLLLGACAGMGINGMGGGGRGGSGSDGPSAPVTPARVTSSNPSSVGSGVTQVATGDAAAAAAANVGGMAGGRSGALGTTIASLGDASQGGLWLKTPLVAAQSQGRVVDAATGRSANVTLIPLGGPASGGSQISLQAMQALGLGLTELPDLRVFGA